MDQKKQIRMAYRIIKEWKLADQATQAGKMAIARLGRGDRLQPDHVVSDGSQFVEVVRMPDLWCLAYEGQPVYLRQCDKLGRPNSELHITKSLAHANRRAKALNAQYKTDKFSSIQLTMGVGRYVARYSVIEIDPNDPDAGKESVRKPFKTKR